MSWGEDLRIPHILLIGDVKSFMVGAIAKDLTDIGYKVTQVLPWVRDVKEVEEKPDVYLVYLDNTNDFSDVLFYLDVAALTSSIKVCFIGEKNQVEKAYLTLPAEHVQEVFLRPVNIKLLGERLEAILSVTEAGFESKHILVIDDDGVAQGLRQFVCDETAEHVSAAARRERHDDLDGLVRKSGVRRRRKGDGRGTHLLRRTAASAMLSEGASREVIASTLGHASRESTETYLVADAEALRTCALDVSRFPLGKGALPWK